MSGPIQIDNDKIIVPMEYLPEHLYNSITEWLSDYLTNIGITGSYSYDMGNITVFNIEDWYRD